MFYNDRISSSSVARMSPTTLIQQPKFWLTHQNIVLALIVGAIIFIIFLWPYIFPAGESAASLSALCWMIIGIMFVGIGWIAFATAKVEVDSAYAEEIKKQADYEYKKLKNIDKGEFPLKDVRGFLPKNDSPLITMPRLAEHIIKNAEDRKFDSSMIIMQPFREEVLNDVFKINGLQKASLQLGIVGTFLGLIKAFIEMGDSGDEIMKALPMIVDALKYSFSTSIAGLVAALSISMGILFILKRQQEAYYRSMEESTDSLIRLCRNATNKDVFLSEFHQVKETADQIHKSVEKQTARLNSHTDSISQGIFRLTETKTQFEGFLNEITRVEGDFIGEMRTIYDKLSPETTSAELKRSLNDAVKGISDGLQTNLVHAIQEYQVLNTNLNRMGENMVEMEKRLSKQVIDYESHSKELRALQKGLHEHVKSLTDRQTEFVERITGQHISASLLGSIESVGKDISNKQSADLTRVIHNMNKLENELNNYNKMVKHELDQQTPYSALKVMVSTAITFVRSSVSYVYSLVKQLFGNV